ncbi:MAG: extracellular solute-binding protein [Clostridia bacterium]|nr:extracellular solute-binding protein [Clostridia bacterium]
MKKLVSLLLAALLLMSAFSFAAAEEPYKITVICTFYGANTPDYENSSIWQKVEELTNTDWDITWVAPGDAAQKFNTVMASTDQPMIYVIPSGATTNANYIDMCQSGIFWDLTDYIQNSDLFRNELTSPAALNATSIDGRNYMFPLISSATRLGLIYRQDWMEALNAKGYDLVPPTNIEEFKAMVEAFSTGDPDGNGINDTIGFAYCDDDDEELDYAGFNLIQAMTGGPVGWGFTEDDKLMPYFFFDEYFETLDIFKWMYDNGYMNSDFAVNTNKHDPLANNWSGSMCTSATGATSNDYDNLNSLVGEGKWFIEAQQVFYTADGKRVTSSTMTPGSLDGVLISKIAVPTEAELEKLLNLFEIMRDPEGEVNKVMSIGIEGVHYEMVDGQPVSTEEQIKLREKESEAVCSYMIPRRIVGIDYGGAKTERQIRNQKILDMNAENEAYAVVDQSTPYMTTDLRNAQYQIATIISDARVKYMVGQIDKDGFIAETQRWLDEGGQEIVDAVNAAYQASK